VRPGEQGQGIGAALVERFCAELSALGVRGVHLLCGERPVGFYEKAGFTIVASAPRTAGGRIYAMGRRLTSSA
jgi:predicted N-acetyltransferase YhbS